MLDRRQLHQIPIDEVMARATRWHRALDDQDARIAFAAAITGHEMYGHAAAVLDPALGPVTDPSHRWLHIQVQFANGSCEAALKALAEAESVQPLSLEQTLIAAQIEIGAGDPGAALVRLAALTEDDHRVAALFALAQAWFETPDAMAEWVLGWQPDHRDIDVLASAAGMLGVWAGTEPDRLHRCMTWTHRLALQRWAIPLFEAFMAQHNAEKDQYTLRSLGMISIVVFLSVQSYSRAAACAQTELLREVQDHFITFCSYSLFLAPMLEEIAGDALKLLQMRALCGLLAAAPPVPFHHDPPAPLGGRRLRVGVLTPWYGSRFHFIALDHRDRTRIEVTAFAVNLTAPPQGDGADRDARGYDSVLFVKDLDDRAIADLIRTRQIDVLLDVTGQGAGERGTVLEWRPAPVQVIWTTKLSTSGSDVVDWFLADAALVPPDHDTHFTERVWRYPTIVTPWQSTFVEIAPEPPPRRATGLITFGSPASVFKVSDDAIRAWSDIVARVPHARFVYTAPATSHSSLATLYDRFIAAGFAPSKLVLLPSLAEGDMQRLLGHVDIALDSFPFGCNRTAAECLAQGVPLLTFWGDRLAGRYTATQLQALGLDELIATDRADYIARAVALAQDGDRLDRWRRELPERVHSSPIVDPRCAMRTLDAALFGMWDEYLARAGARAGAL